MTAVGHERQARLGAAGNQTVAIPHTFENLHTCGLQEIRSGPIFAADVITLRLSKLLYTTQTSTGLWSCGRQTLQNACAILR